MRDYPSTVALVVRQIRYQVTYFFRVPVALFFTLILPIVMLVLFNALFGDNTVTIDGGEWPIRQFYTGGLAAYTAVSATYSNIGNMVPIRRDEGILKRWRSTPLPTWIYMAGLIGASVLIAFTGTILMLAMGYAFYDLSIVWAKMPAAFVPLLVGVASFAALGMAVTKRSNDPNYGIHLEYVDPTHFVHSYTEDPTFSDIVYAGHIREIPLSELRRIAGDQLTDEDYKAISKNPS